MEGLTAIKNWWQQQSKTAKAGYRVLLQVATPTEAVAAAQTLGKELKQTVHRVDLAQMISPDISETEKNLAAVFKKAEDKNWILFFDEADALFGKRTGVQNAHDRYANLEVNYLLQQAESYPGLVVLATKEKGKMDPSFIRRFQTVLHFPLT